MNGSTPRDWRTRIVRQTALFMVLSGGFLLAGLSTSGLPLTSPGPVFGLAGMAVLGYGLMPRSRLSPRVLSFVVVGYGSIAGLLAVAQLGPVMNAGIALALGVLIGGLLFGRRGALVLLALDVVALLVLGLAIAHGLLEAPPNQFLEPARYDNWVRVAVVFGFVSGAIVYAVLPIVEQIDASRAEALRTVEALRREQAERARLEEEHAAAQRALADARHLESMGRLAGGVAHDFNNLLMVVMSAAEELRARSDDGVREVAGEILQAATSAGTLTKQLLAIGRRDLFRPEATALDEALREHAGTLRRLLPAEVALDVTPASGATCMVDPAHLQQIVLNLGLRARDAMLRGGTLSLATRATTHDGAPAAELSVRDTGEGLDPEALARIFEPFFAERSAGRGAGLGLASVHGMVERAGGHVTVESGGHAGTTFRVVFPALSAPAPAAATAPPPEVDDGPVLPAGPILLAEDQPDVRAVMCHTLEGAGYTLLVARDGDEALALVDAHAHELALLCTDAVMPGAPVAHILAALRARRPDLPVLVCSGYVHEALLRREVEAGRGALLEKPFTPETLLRSVQALLRRARPPAGGAA